MKHRFPPLWVWACTMGFVMLTVFVIGSSGIIDIRHGFGTNYGSFRSRLAHLKSTAEINEGDKVVVVIGSSFTAMAVDHRPFFYDKYQQSHGGNLHVFKLYMYGCNAEVFQRLPEFFEMAASLQPDIVCVEEHLLAINENPDTDGMSIPSWISDFNLGVNAIRSYFLPESDSTEWHDVPTFEFFWKYHDTTYHADSLEVGQKPNYQVRNYASNRRLNKWLKTYVPDNTHIVCISIPRAPHAEEKLAKLRGQEDYLSLRDKYEEQHEVDFWIFPDTLPYIMYSGDDHLNMTGMR